MSYNFLKKIVLLSSHITVYMIVLLESYYWTSYNCLYDRITGVVLLYPNIDFIKHRITEHRITGNHITSNTIVLLDILLLNILLLNIV